MEYFIQNILSFFFSYAELTTAVAAVGVDIVSALDYDFAEARHARAG